MLCAIARVVYGQLYPTPANLTRHVVLCLAVVALAASPALADNPPDSDSTGHVLIGMTPGQGFEVSCEDSVLFLDPVVASDLGILEFHIEGRHGPFPNTVCIRIPAPPQIMSVHASALADVSATISWLTDRPATSRVEYGLTGSYGMATPEDPTLVVSHDVPLTYLEPELTYHYRVVSTDAFGNQTFGGDRTFTTLPPHPTLSGVSVSGVTETSFDVTWATSSPCDSYVEYGPTDSYGAITPTSQEFQTDHVATVSGLIPGATYHFRACGTDDLGRAVCSPDFSATTLAGALVVFNLSVTDTTATSAMIEWQTTRPASSWVLYGQSDVSENQTGNNDLVTDHQITIDGLEPNTLYIFRVLSMSASGSYDESDVHQFETPCYPLEIGGPLIAGRTHTTVTVSWTTSRPADGRIEYGEDESYGQVADGDPDLSLGHEVTIEGLSAGMRYHVRAVSTDANACTARSPDVVVSTEPYALSLFSVSVPETTATSATISWQTNNASACRVEYGPTANYGFFSEENPFPLTEHTVVLGDLAPRTLYYFRIHATDTHGQNAISARLQFSTPNQDGPGGLLIHGVVANQIGPTFAAICWQTNADATSTVHYGTTPELGLTAWDQEMTSDHCLVLTGLAPGTRYYYRVSSEDGGQFTAESQMYSFLTPSHDNVAPGAPDGLTASQCHEGVRLLWNAGPEFDLDGYRVYRRVEDDTHFDRVAELSQYETSWVDDGVVERWTYEYAVTALDLEGNESGLSPIVAVTAGTSASGRLWVYPNPVTQKTTTISFAAPYDCDGSFTVSIYDARGRLVKTVAKGRAGRDVSSVLWNTRDNTDNPVSSGIYFCVVSFSSQSVRSKIMVVR
ncbi:MAG: fibronectin type III domain-containing protein [Candidatus Eisenbacteria bacterium]